MDYMEQQLEENVMEETTKVENGEESKADRFKRLATKRVNSVLKQIDLIGNLSGSSYEYTDEQVEKMFESMQAALDAAKIKFSKSKNHSDKDAFTFD